MLSWTKVKRKFKNEMIINTSILINHFFLFHLFFTFASAELNLFEYEELGGFYDEVGNFFLGGVFIPSSK